MTDSKHSNNESSSEISSEEEYYKRLEKYTDDQIRKTEELISETQKKLESPSLFASIDKPVDLDKELDDLYKDVNQQLENAMKKINEQIDKIMKM